MMNYDPNMDLGLSTPIPLNEELARQPEPTANQSVPQGLLRAPPPEKNVDESQQMADFSTPIEEVMQNDVMGSPYGPGGAAGGQAVHNQAGPSAAFGGPTTQKSAKKSGSNPFGLTDEQFQAALAGAAAVVAFSKPVQDRLRTMVPKFVGESGDVSLTGLAVTALISAIVFYILKKFITERTAA